MLFYFMHLEKGSKWEKKQKKAIVYFLEIHVNKMISQLYTFQVVGMEVDFPPYNAYLDKTPPTKYVSEKFAIVLLLLIWKCSL